MVPPIDVTDINSAENDQDAPKTWEIIDNTENSVGNALNQEDISKNTQKIQKYFLEIPKTDKLYFYDYTKTYQYLYFDTNKWWTLPSYIWNMSFEDFVLKYQQSDKWKQFWFTSEKINDIRQIVDTYNLKNVLSSYIQRNSNDENVIDWDEDARPPLIFNQAKFYNFLSESMPNEDVERLRSLQLHIYLGLVLAYLIEQFKETPLYKKLDLLRWSADNHIQKLLPNDVDIHNEEKLLIHMNAFHNYRNGHMNSYYEYLEILPNYTELLHTNYADMLWVPKQFQFDIAKEVSVEWENVMVIAQWFFDTDYFAQSGYIKDAKYVVCVRDWKKVFIYDTWMTEHKFITAKYWYTQEEVLGWWKMDITTDWAIVVHDGSYFYGLDPYQSTWLTQKVFEQLLKVE